MFSYTARVNAQRAATKLYKQSEYRHDIGFKFKLDDDKEKIVKDYWKKHDENMVGEPPSKRQRVSVANKKQEDDDSKQVEKSKTRKVTPKQFRFKEQNRIIFFGKCIDMNIMSFSKAFRDVKFRNILDELIVEDEKWALVSMDRFQDQFYSKYKEVLKLVKNNQENKAVLQSDKMLLKYVKALDQTPNALSYHDGFS